MSKCHYIWKLGTERGHDIPMQLLFGLRQVGLKQEVHDVPYLGHLLFILELLSFMLERHFVVRLIKTT